jgi:hypothetical protein
MFTATVAKAHLLTIRAIRLGKILGVVREFAGALRSAVRRQGCFWRRDRNRGAYLQVVSDPVEQ